MRDIDDYRRHIENNCHPAYRKALAKEFMEKDKEIERLKEELRISKMSDKDTYETSQEIMAEQSKEIERLHSIIKEVREYNEHLIRDAKYHLNDGHLKKMKKILDKVEENNNGKD